jgi:hypothetical protein
LYQYQVTVTLMILDSKTLPDVEGKSSEDRC